MRYILEKKDIEELIDLRTEKALKDIKNDMAILLNWKIEVIEKLNFLINQVDKLKEMMVGSR